MTKVVFETKVSEGENMGRKIEFPRGAILQWKLVEAGFYRGLPPSPHGYSLTIDKSMRGKWIALWHPSNVGSNHESKLIGLYVRLSDAKKGCEEYMRSFWESDLGSEWMQLNESVARS